jgi:hypothetical protein
MEFAIRLFFMAFGEILKRRWYLVLIPVFVTVIHGAYTGKWYVLYGIIVSVVVTVIAAISATKNIGR